MTRKVTHCAELLATAAIFQSQCILIFKLLFLMKQQRRI